MAEVEKERLEREAKAAEAKTWATFMEHVRSGKLAPEEKKYLSDVEAVALGRSTGSRVLKELGSQVTPENAHALLLRLSHWDETVKRYPTVWTSRRNTPQLRFQHYSKKHASISPICRRTPSMTREAKIRTMPSAWTGIASGSMSPMSRH